MLKGLILGTVLGITLAWGMAAFSGNGIWFTCEGEFEPVWTETDPMKHKKPWSWKYTLRCGKG